MASVAVDDAMRSSRIFVGGLSPEANEENLQSLFAAFGPVISVRVLRERPSARAKG